MKPHAPRILAALLALSAIPAASAQIAIGEPAPAFELPDARGNLHRLSDHVGSVVVLEWINVDCPFVKKHYAPGHMQSLQEKYAAQGVVWLSICSSAPGQQGHFEADEWPGVAETVGSKAAAILLDPAGTVGRAYEAKTTPHMFVIDAQGLLAYDGAIDDKRSTNPADIPNARPYLTEAVDALLAGNPVPTPKTVPYGCSVKY